MCVGSLAGVTHLRYTVLTSPKKGETTPGEGGGVLNTEILIREAPPRGPTPYPFIYHFGKKATPLKKKRKRKTAEA